eukprot:scaffold101022_cov42-Prasinocladus_malaysianus.AAC.1
MSLEYPPGTSTGMQSALVSTEIAEILLQNDDDPATVRLVARVPRSGRVALSRTSTVRYRRGSRVLVCSSLSTGYEYS